MSQALSVAFAAGNDDNLVGAPANVSLRGTTRGLEILIAGTPSTAALGARLTELLAEAPSFFAGSHACIAVEGALPSGALACLEEIAARFEIHIVEIGPVAAKRRRPDVPAVLRPDDVPQVHLAEGTGPIVEEAVELRGCAPGDAAPGDAGPTGSAPGDTISGDAARAAIVPDDAAPTDMALANTARINAVAAPSVSAGPSDNVPVAAPPTKPAPSASAGPSDVGAAADMAAELAAAVPPGPRLVIGPVRSGVIVDHVGHVIVIGDVNPGAEVRAEGSIIVLGRLRGVAHAAIGREAGFIVALSLAPQQLRIGRVVARAGDADHPGDGAEIAYATGETIVVERFLGRLPSGLAASM